MTGHKDYEILNCPRNREMSTYLPAEGETYLSLFLRALLPEISFADGWMDSVMGETWFFYGRG